MNPVSCINPDALYHEPPAISGEHLPGGGMFSITVGGSRIFISLYIPQGNGPHPVMLMLHGLPGIVRSEDIAQGLRRAGMAACIFSYRGSWGSEGDWSYRHALEDAFAVYNTLRDPEVAARYRLDPERILILGHSMGGLLAALVARDTAIRDVVLMSAADSARQWRQFSGSAEAKAKRLKRLAMLAEPLHGTSAEALWDEMDATALQMDLHACVEAWKPGNFLFIGAEFDTILPLAEYFDPVVEALERRQPGRVRTCVLPTGHNYNSHRMELTAAILHWLRDIGY